MTGCSCSRQTRRTASSLGASSGDAGAPARPQKNSRSCANRSDSSGWPRTLVRNCASKRDAMRLVYRSEPNKPAAWASNIAAASCHSVPRCEEPSARAPAPKSAQRSLMRRSDARPGSRISARTSVSIAPRASSSALQGAAAGSSGNSSHCQSSFHRSAGWTRSAPASASAARYCGNSITGDTGLRANCRDRKSSKAKDTRSITSTAAVLTMAGLLIMRCTALSLARSTSATAAKPTSSSAPTPWCNCVRALRSTDGSTESRSLPLTVSASFR